MFRELTKSAISCSWALTLLGLKQAVSLARPGQQNGGNLFAPVTQVAVGQLDESMKGIYRSADNMGSRAVDMAFSWMNPLNWLDPTRWTNVGNWINPGNWAQSFGNCGGKPSSGSSSQGPASAGTTGGAGPTGWGPMPDAKQ